MKFLFLLFGSIVLLGCNSHKNKDVNDTKKSVTVEKTEIKNDGLQSKHPYSRSFEDTVAEFERKIYLEIDQIYSGKTYIDKNNQNVFNRILVIPEEENIMLIAENISFGDEGGNFKLVKLSRITDDGSILPRFGLSSADSIKFVDSVNVQGYFNGKKMIINVSKLKDYHPIFKSNSN